MRETSSGVVWLTGISGAGKSTIAERLDCQLRELGVRSFVLDGDGLRQGLCSDLGFTEVDRAENVRRVAEVARLIFRTETLVIVALISPFAEGRRRARALFEPDEFCEVFVDTPLVLAEARDPKGLYKRARSGDLQNVSGIDSPYEAPEHPEVLVRTAQVSPDEAVEAILDQMRAMSMLRRC